MFRNYFKTAIRNLKRNKVFSVINIMGLSLGLACSLFIFLWVKDERNMDKFNAHSAQIYNIYEHQFSGGKLQVQPNTPGIMADEMKRVLPDVQYASGFTNFDGQNTFQVGDKIIKEDGGYAGEDFFKIFSYRLLGGNPNTALHAPADIAVSRKMAEDFFGSPAKAIGQVIRFNNRTDFKVSAVFDVPANASTKFDYLINWYNLLQTYPWLKSWNNTGVITYVMLKPDANPQKFQQQTSHFLNKYAEFGGDYRVELGIQRFDEMYLYSTFNSKGYPDGGRIEYLRLFSIVALFILLIACINFMNLTTARSIKRAKEIGIRKVVGARRAALIWQFIGESLLLSFLSIIIALLIVVILLPVFNSLVQKQIKFPFSDLFFWGDIAAIVLATGLVSGSYPALFLSSLRPVKVLKGSMKLGGRNVMFRKGLVVFQFVMAAVLIIGTIVVSRQVNYIRTKDLGYNRENLIYIPTDGNINTKFNLFKERAMSMPGIASVSRISGAPDKITSGTWGVDWEGKDPNFKPTVNVAGIGYDFIKTMDIHFLAGRDLSPNIPTDTNAYILNESAAKLTGYKDPVGKSFTLWGRKASIIGVIKDFNFNTLHIPVNAMVLFYGARDDKSTLLVRTRPGQTQAALASLGKLCKQMNPKFPFTYQFADKAYNKLYKSDQTAGSLSRCFAILGILISCLGLLGLAMFTAEQRTKEIGIRKVLGASIASLFGLLSKEFVMLVMISLLIASPIAWWAMNKWLQGYAYHTQLSWWMFATAGAAAVLIALLTISYQAIKTAVANPVEALRNE